MTIATLLIALCVPAADRADAPVILDFTAPWCGPCQSMKPAVAQLEKSGFPIKAVDYDKSPLVRRYKVTGIPTFIVIDAEGRELDRTSATNRPPTSPPCTAEPGRSSTPPPTKERQGRRRPAGPRRR